MNETPSPFFRSIINQLMLAVFTSFVLLAGYFIYAKYEDHISTSQQLILSELSTLTMTLSLEISADALVSIAEKYPNKDGISSKTQDSVYLEIHQLLAKHQALHQLKTPIYTLTFDSTSRQFEFLVTSADQPYFRHKYLKVPSELEENYLVGGRIEAYKTENGSWISAFSPIVDANGSVVAVIEADHEFNTFIADARNLLMKNILIAFGLVLFTSIILFRFMKKVLGREMRMKGILQKKNREIIGQNEEIRAQHEEIIAQNEKISESNKALEGAKRMVEEKNSMLSDANKLLDDKVKERTRALEESMENLDNFLYRSYHDILGPIATIKGLCELSKLDIKDKTALSYVGKIDNSIDNLKQSIKKVNAVYELKNRHFTPEIIDIKNLVSAIIEKQQYLFQLSRSPLNNFITPHTEVATDRFFLDLLLSDIIRNIIAYSNNTEIEPISFDATKKEKNGLSLLIHDPGNHEIFLKSYFQFHHKQAISVNHDLYIFHSALNKLKCKIINYDDKEKGQTMEIIIPNNRKINI